MNYIIDTNSLRILQDFYYRESFKKFWTKMDELIVKGTILSVRDVRLELEKQQRKDFVNSIKNLNKNFFSKPSTEGSKHLIKIFKNKHFQQMINQKNIVGGLPSADPFLIAKAMEIKGTVITQEKHQPNSAKIPTVCKAFSVPCIDLSQFLIELEFDL